ncbi:MAG: glycosyltransferase family 39 protein [Armatimonadota bacterium]
MRARSILVALIIIGLPVGFMHRTIVDGRPLARDDASAMVYPFFRALDAEADRGRLYLWDVQQWCGLPVMARGEVGSLYPPHLILAALLPWMTALHASYWLHLALGAAGVYLVARNLGASRTAAVVGGAAFAFSGYQSAHLVHFAHIVGVAYVPMMPAVLQRALEANSPRWWALFAVVCAFGFMGSHPQVFLMAATVCLLWLLFGHDWRSEASVASRIVPLLLAAVVSGFLVMPQLLPMMELALAGEHGLLDGEAALERVTSFGFHGRDMVRVLLPSFFGTVHENIIGGGPPWHESSPFTGAAPLLLGIAGAIVAFRRRGWGFCIAIFAVGAVLMPAEGNPIHAALARLPVLGGFRAWGRWMVLPILSLSLLSALAITYLPAVSRRLRLGASRTVGALAALIVTVTTILWLVFGVDAEGRLWLPGQGGDFPLRVAADAMLNCMTSLEPVLLVGAAIVTWIVTARLASRKPPGLMAAAVLLVAVTAPQWYLWQQTNLTAPREFYRDAPATASVAAGGRIVTLAPGVVAPEWSAPGDTRQQRAMNERELLLPGLGTVWGVRYAHGYTQGLVPPAMQTYRENWFHYAAQAFTGRADVRERALEVYGTPAERMKRLHRLAGVHHIVTVGEIDDPELILAREGVANVYSYADSHPRWWLAEEAIAIGEPEAQLSAIKRKQFDPGRQVVVDRPVDLPAASGEEAGRVTLVDERPTRITLHAECPGPRVLVLADTWYPGWSVTVDGERGELLRANYAFRGVVLPAGEHTVTFSFRPAAWGRALPMFAIGLLVVLALLIWPKREPPREGLTPP